MRVVAWTFVLCTVAAAIGVFLPCIELALRGASLGKRTEISLYRANENRALVRRLLAAYHASDKPRAGADLARKVSPHVGGRARAWLEDARDAVDTLDGVSNKDVETATAILVGTTWALLGIEALMVLLVFTELMRGAFRRGKLYAALLVSIVATLVASAVHVACREVVWQANDELGAKALALDAGAYVMPLGALAALVAVIILLKQQRRAAAV